MDVDEARARALLAADPCFWNPKEGRAAWDHEVHAAAELIIGREGKWRLCRSCAELEAFSRFKVRREIRRTR